MGGEVSGFLALLVSVITAAISIVILQSIKWYVKWKSSRKDVYKNLFSKIHDIYTILNTIVSETGAKRALILKAENGGGIPEVGKHIYSSIIYETVATGAEKLKDSWQDQKLDESHNHILGRMHADNTYASHTADLPDCLLKDFLEADGVEHILKYKISTKRYFFYLSIHFGNPITPNAALRNQVRSSVNSLHKIFEKDVG